MQKHGMGVGEQQVSVRYEACIFQVYPVTDTTTIQLLAISSKHFLTVIILVLSMCGHSGFVSDLPLRDGNWSVGYGSNGLTILDWSHGS